MKTLLGKRREVERPAIGKRRLTKRFWTCVLVSALAMSLLTLLPMYRDKYTGDTMNALQTMGGEIHLLRDPSMSLVVFIALAAHVCGPFILLYLIGGGSEPPRLRTRILLGGVTLGYGVGAGLTMLMLSLEGAIFGFSASSSRDIEDRLTNAVLHANGFWVCTVVIIGLVFVFLPRWPRLQ